MAKYCGKVCYYTEVEVEPDIWVKQKIEKTYKGDANRISKSSQDNDSTNDSIRMNIELSLIADPFAYENFMFIIYAEYMGQRWKVTNATPQKPRIILQLGNLYKEDENVNSNKTKT